MTYIKRTTPYILRIWMDIAVVAFSWLLAYLFRFEILSGGEKNLELLFLQLTPLLIAVTMYCMSRHNLYAFQYFTSKTKEVMAVARANILSVVVFVIIIYFTGVGVASRLTIFCYLIISTVSIAMAHLSLGNFLRRKGYNLQRTLLVGNSENLAKYVDTSRAYKKLGISFMGWIDSEGLAQEMGIDNIDKTYKEFRQDVTPDVVILSYKQDNSDKISRFLTDNYDEIIPIKLLSNIPNSLIGNKVEEFYDIPILHINAPPHNEIEMFLKRVMDIVLSSIGLLVLSPFLILIAITIKLSSRGPILFRQERMGLAGHTFIMWKFRTMKAASEKEENTEWTSKGSPRNTLVGRVLRKSSLDELPQLWNILVGDMSIIGPRPERPLFVKKFKEEIPGYMLRYKMKAGLSGWAQVNGLRGDTSLHKRIEHDIYYIKNWSLWFDIKIIFLTILKGFFHKNAY